MLKQEEAADRRAQHEFDLKADAHSELNAKQRIAVWPMTHAMYFLLLFAFVSVVCLGLLRLRNVNGNVLYGYMCHCNELMGVYVPLYAARHRI